MLLELKNPWADSLVTRSTSGARFRTYERLKRYTEVNRGFTFLPLPDLAKAIEEIYRFCNRAVDRSASGDIHESADCARRISDEKLAELVIATAMDLKFRSLPPSTKRRRRVLMRGLSRSCCSLGLAGDAR